MENEKKPRLRRWAVGIILAGLALFGIWYHIPLHRTLEVTAYATQGDAIGAPAVFQMDITLHRSFFRSTVIRGTIELDGVSYVDYPLPEASSGSFLAGLRNKLSGRILSDYFVEAERRAGLGIATYMWEDSLWIFDISFRGFYDSIERLTLVRHIPDAPSVCYVLGY